MYGWEMLSFNIHDGFLEAIVRGNRSGLLTAADYNNLCQCETLDDIKMHLTATEYGPYLQNGEILLLRLPVGVSESTLVNARAPRFVIWLARIAILVGDSGMALPAGPLLELEPRALLCPSILHLRILEGKLVSPDRLLVVRIFDDSHSLDLLRCLQTTI